MIWILNDLGWTFALFVFSLVSIILIGYFKLGNSFESANQIVDYFNSTALVKKLSSKLNDRQCESNSIDTNNKKYSTFYKMTSLERKQSFIKRSLDERNKKHQQADQHESSFIYSSIFSFTKTLINRAPKSLTTSSSSSTAVTTKKNLKNETDLLAKNTTALSSLSLMNNKLIKTKLPLHNTMSTLNENENKLIPRLGLSKSVSLQIKDEMKAAIPKNRLLHQSSSGSGSSNSSTPADLFSLAEKGRIGNLRSSGNKNKQLANNKVYQQQPTYTELVNQIQNHEDAINREYLLHQLNPSQYHSMHYYRRLERQNCLSNNKKLLSNQKIASKQTTLHQSNSSSNQENNNSNSNELEYFSSSSSNLSCSECGSLDTEEELTLPFAKKSNHYQPNVSLRAKKPLKLSSSLDKSNLNSTATTTKTTTISKQCSSDSNEAMVGLLNENFIKRQLSNGTYLKLSDRLNDKLSDKRKRIILGRRLTAQNSFTNSFSAGSSFNNSSNNSSFDHDDMIVQFTSYQTNSFSNTDTNNNHFHFNHHYENNSIHSNDTSSSSNSSCGHRHAERVAKNTLNLNEFNNLNLCDNQLNHLNQTDLVKQEDEYNNLNSPLAAAAAANNILHITHAYDPTTKKLRIRIIKADYVPIQQNQDCDRCYIKLILLPNKRQKFKTTTKSCSNNPIEFDELFTFNRIAPEAIISLSIKYLFYLVNNESKHRIVGEGTIRFDLRKPMQQEDNLIVYLDTINLDTNNNSSLEQCNFNVIRNQHNQLIKQQQNTANESLSDVSSICRSDSAESHHSIQLNLPELLIGLAYNATTGRLQVAILRGSQFKAKAKSNKPLDTFVKCVLLSSAGREIGRAKTSVKRYFNLIF